MLTISFLKHFISDFTRIRNIPLDDIDLDDGKDITIATSNGSLASSSNLSSTLSASQITIKSQNGKATFFYTTGSTAVKSAILSLNLSDIVQVFKFEIFPVEPSNIQITSSPIFPSSSENIEVTAHLLNAENETIPSEDLQINFSTSNLTLEDSIQTSFAGSPLAYTEYDEESKTVIAKKTVITNKLPGKFQVVATYTKIDGEKISETLDIIVTE